MNGENEKGFSYKIVYDRRKEATAKSKGTVEIEVYKNRKRKWVSTGVRIYPKEWKNGMVVNRFDAVELNLQIKEKYEKLVFYLEKEGGDLANIVNRDAKINFLEWLELQIDKRKDVSARTKILHKQVVNSLRKFGRIQNFSDITTKNIMLWDDFIRTHASKQTTIHGYHKNLKPYINKALQFELIKKNPYANIKISRGKSETIKFISEEERNKIEQLELTGTMEIVRDLFIFSCYTGLADADIRKISKGDITEEDGKLFIIDKRIKTGSQYKLLLLPKALEIIKKYDYNLNLLTNQKCNQYLKAIQSLAGIKINLTMHVGRHTFATWALKRGVRIEVVSKMLAHKDIATTQIYAKVLQEEVTKGFDLLR